MPESCLTPHILESLHNPAVYPVKTGTVELIQTHVSWLFLTDTHVFKFKKPVNFGFLDFSTLDLRRLYCYEELRLNRRLCPEIYEAVLELHKTDSGVSFSGPGKVIDYAVMMKRLPANGMLDRLVDGGSISVEDIQIVARKIAVFHSEAPTSEHISHFGSTDQIAYNWRENFEQTVQFRNSTLPTEVSETIHSYVETFIASEKNLIAERVEKGFIRECDGDIHLGNICLLESTAYIFDCIEFNERFRCSDTAADIAFLLMDLDYHQRPDLAEAALAAYINTSGDPECAKLVQFYKVYRAFVRGKVESLQLNDSGIGETERITAEKRAGRYFRLAQGYCLRSCLPLTLFITCGTMGCGKSTLAHQLAFELGLANFNSDNVRKQLVGLPPEAAARVAYGDGIYSPEMNRATYAQLGRLAERELHAGRSVIIDAGFGARFERENFARIAGSHQAKFVILSVQCDPYEQQQRLHERSLHPSVSDGRVELLEQQISTFEPPDKSEGCCIQCTSSGTAQHYPDTAIQHIYETLMILKLTARNNRSKANPSPASP